MSAAQEGLELVRPTYWTAPAVKPEKQVWTIWTDKKLTLLGTTTDGQVGRRLGLSVSAVRAKRSKLGIPPWRPTAWKAAEDRIVARHTDAEAAAILGRTVTAVLERRRQLRRRAQARPFTPQEKKRVGTRSDSYVAKILRREVSEVRAMREAMGIPKAGLLPEKPWTQRELRLLGKQSDADVAERLGRSPLAVARMRNELGIQPIYAMKRWSRAEDYLIRTKSLEEVAAMTGRTRRAVRARRLFLGIRTVSRRRWKATELALLGTAADQTIAKRLGRTTAAVKLKRVEMGKKRLQTSISEGGWGRRRGSQQVLPSPRASE